MRLFLLSTWQPDAPPPASLDMAGIMRGVDELDQEMKAAGVAVFGTHLRPPESAVVVRAERDGTVTTAGPYLAGDEHMGGLIIVRAPDLEAALVWARKLARVTTLPIEVRQFTAEA